jgi:prepilin-type N-terminal cleavage/methylation domain-containing protein
MKNDEPDKRARQEPRPTISLHSAFPDSGVQAGFTLVELIVVAAIMLIVYTLYLGPGTRRYESNRLAECRRNLQFVYVALQTYANDSRDAYPLVKGAATSEVPLSLLVPRATTSTEHFVCPRTGQKAPPAAKPFANRRISYAYLMGLTKDASPDQWLMADALVDAKPKKPGELVFSADGKKAGANHRQFGGNLLLADGRTVFSPARAEISLDVPSGAVALNPKP